MDAHERLEQLLDEEALKKIIEETDAEMKHKHAVLSEKAAGMDNVETYRKLLDYCFDKCAAYLDDPANMKAVLLEPRHLQQAYDTLVGADEFKTIGGEEYKGFPRVIAMTILAGSEVSAADCALHVLGKKDKDAAGALEALGNIYREYVREAIAYGNGERKKVGLTGKVD